MKEARFHFHSCLQDFLPKGSPAERVLRFHGAPAVKDLIEASGIPHPEVESIRANGKRVDFAYGVQAGDQIEVEPYRHPRRWGSRFVLDGHLGRLAAYLRMLGLDTAWEKQADDEQLAKCSAREDRILLTRDIGLLKRGIVRQGYWIRETAPRKQLREVLDQFELEGAIEPFLRCMRCNGLLEPVAKEVVRSRLLPRTADFYQEFFLCSQCGQIYWKGSHFQDMTRWLGDLRKEDSNA